MTRKFLFSLHFSSVQRTTIITATHFVRESDSTFFMAAWEEEEREESLFPTLDAMAQLSFRVGDRMSFSSLCSLLSIKEEEVVGCYLVGSRLWGTATQQSDWDVIIILRGERGARGDSGGKKKGGEGDGKRRRKGEEPSPLAASLKSGEKGKAVVHKSNVDAICYSLETFQEELKKHRFLPLLCSLLLPPQWRWKEEKTSLPPLTLAQIDLKLLIGSVEEEVERDIAVAEKKEAKGLVREGKKVLAHALRMLLISCQLSRLLLSSPMTSASDPFDLWGDCMDSYPQVERDGWERIHEMREEWGVWDKKSTMERIESARECLRKYPCR